MYKSKYPLRTFVIPTLRLTIFQEKQRLRLLLEDIIVKGKKTDKGYLRI